MGGDERGQKDEPREESIGNGLPCHIEEFGLFFYVVVFCCCCYFVYLSEVNGRDFEQEKKIHWMK